VAQSVSVGHLWLLTTVLHTTIESGDSSSVVVVAMASKGGCAPSTALFELAFSNDKIEQLLWWETEHSQKYFYIAGQQHYMRGLIADFDWAQLRYIGCWIRIG
jgi:hypothetical protein